MNIKDIWKREIFWSGITNHNFNFQGSKLLVDMQNKQNARKLLKLLLFPTTIISNKDPNFSIYFFI